MTDRKPREFWTDGVRITDDEDLLCSFEIERVFKVREVLPDGPDWKSLCTELAKALEWTDIGKSSAAMDRYREALKNDPLNDR